jgi:hypothetical protein
MPPSIDYQSSGAVRKPRRSPDAVLSRLAACFITHLGTMLAPGGLFAVTTVATLFVLARLTRFVIAKHLFQPEVVDVEEEDAVGAEDISVVHHVERP